MSIVTDQFEKFFGASAPTAPLLEQLNLNDKTKSKYNTTFFLDLTTYTYGHMNSNCRELTGYSANYLIEGGVDSYVNLWAPDNVDAYLNRIVPITAQYLSMRPPARSAELVFGRTYFIKAKNGDTRKILERDVFLCHPSCPKPVAATGYAIDITHVSDMNKTTFFVEENTENGYSAIIYKEDFFHTAESKVLTAKEIEVLRWIAEGLSSKQIAHKMRISIHTVNNHRKNMLSKTSSMNAVDLVKFGYSHHLL